MRLVFLAAPIPRFRLCRWWELKIDFDNAEPMSAPFLGVLVGVCCRPTDLFPADLDLDRKRSHKPDISTASGARFGIEVNVCVQVTAAMDRRRSLARYQLGI